MLWLIEWKTEKQECYKVTKKELKIQAKVTTHDHEEMKYRAIINVTTTEDMACVKTSNQSHTELNKLFTFLFLQITHFSVQNQVASLNLTREIRNTN